MTTRGDGREAGDSDEALVEAVRAGDRRALEKLLERHASGVYRFGMKMCRQEEDAKDVLQETLLAAARHLPEFRGASSITTWLYTVARSFCIKKRRTSKFAPQQLESLEAQGDLASEIADARRGPEEDVAGRQLQRALDEAIGSLEPMYREVLLLRDVEGLSAPEVAEIMGLSVEAVKSRLHRARIAVREAVAPLLGVPPPAAAGAAPCPDVVELLSKHLEGEISAPVCAEMERHLASCPGCTARCESLQRTLATCRASPLPEVPQHVQASVRQALRSFIQLPG